MDYLLICLSDIVSFSSSNEDEENSKFILRLIVFP